MTGSNIIISKKFYQKLLKYHQRYNETRLKNFKHGSITFDSLHTDVNFIKGITTIGKTKNSKNIKLSKEFFDYLVDIYNRYTSLKITIDKIQDDIRFQMKVARFRAECEADDSD